MERLVVVVPGRRPAASTKTAATTSKQVHKTAATTSKHTYHARPSRCLIAAPVLLLCTCPQAVCRLYGRQMAPWSVPSPPMYSLFEGGSTRLDPA